MQGRAAPYEAMRHSYNKKTRPLVELGNIPVLFEYLTRPNTCRLLKNDAGPPEILWSARPEQWENRLVALVFLVYPVRLVQPNKRDNPEQPDVTNGSARVDVLARNSDRRHVACLGGSTRCEREDVV